MKQGVVLYSKRDGIYLGCCLGLGFWTELETAGQDAAVVFDDEEQARAHMASWDLPPPEDVRLVLVTMDRGNYASIESCVAAGLPAWHPDGVTAH